MYQFYQPKLRSGHSVRVLVLPVATIVYFLVTYLLPQISHVYLFNSRVCRVLIFFSSAIVLLRTPSIAIILLWACWACSSASYIWLILIFSCHNTKFNSIVVLKGLVILSLLNLPLLLHFVIIKICVFLLIASANKIELHFNPMRILYCVLFEFLFQFVFVCCSFLCLAMSGASCGMCLIQGRWVVPLCGLELPTNGRAVWGQ